MAELSANGEGQLEVATAAAPAAEPSNGSNGAPVDNGPPPTPDNIRRFLPTLFEPKDRILQRPIETWTRDDGTKGTRVIYQEVRYNNPSSYLIPHVWARILKVAKDHRANLFFGVCPRFSGRGGTFDLAWQIRTVRVRWSDIDHCTPDEALKRCDAAGLPAPTIVVQSGHGVHLYWRLIEPFLIDDVGDPAPVETEWVEIDGKKKPRHYIEVDGERIYEFLDLKAKKKNPDWPKVSPKGLHIQDILSGIAAQIGGDHTQDLSRLLRLPCTLNRKDQRNGKEPVPCELAECDPTRRYPLADFERFVEASPARAKAKEVANGSKAYSGAAEQPQHVHQRLRRGAGRVAERGGLRPLHVGHRAGYR